MKEGENYSGNERKRGEEERGSESNRCRDFFFVVKWKKGVKERARVVLGQVCAADWN